MTRRAPVTFRASALALSALLCSTLLPPTDADAQVRNQETREKATREAAEPGTGPSESDGWYALRITRGDTGVIVTHFWSRGRSLRAEAVLSGVLIQQIVSGEWYYVIDGVRGTGIAVRRSTEALHFDRSHPRARPFGNEAADLIARGAEVVREEQVGGRKAKVHRLTDEQGRHEIWVTDDASALPVRIDSTDRNSGAHIITDYVDWLSAVQAPVAFFEPDPRIQLERIEYDEYVERAPRERLGPAPVLFGDLLHGRIER
jgi:hypothetical protein